MSSRTRKAAAPAALAATIALCVGAAPASAGQAPVSPAFATQAMWIWQLPRTEGGSLQRIIARARANGIGAVYIKSADAGNRWSQFSRTTVRRLERAGLRVCGWQFVYGSSPTAEARAGAAAKAAGAECLIIDAESSYEGRYRSATTYMRQLRKRVGPSFPLGFTSFPYVDYHPTLPYSVFLGSGGAQVNMPQVYWRDIGTKVTTAMRHTWQQNRIYGRPIHPIGQTYQQAPLRDIARFRAMAQAWEAPGHSWWEWSTTSARQWRALGRRPVSRLRLADPGWPTLRYGSRGDPVVQAQRLLSAAGYRSVRPTGVLRSRTARAIRALQSERGIPVDGVLGASTWPGLMKAAASRITARNRRVSGGLTPRSASMGGSRDELRSRR